MQLKEYLNQQREIKHQEEVITKLKQFNREKSIKRAESREKMLNKMEFVDKPEILNRGGFFVIVLKIFVQATECKILQIKD